MQIRQLQDRQEIEAFLRQDVYLHLYSLGDLDDFFFPHTRWLGGYDQGELRALALVYEAFQPPILLGLAAQKGEPFLRSLLITLIPELPDQVYAHLSPGLAPLFENRFRLQYHGRHLKLALTSPGRLSAIEPVGVRQLKINDAAELTRLYDEHYPEHSFDPALLETGFFYGIRRSGKLVCAAGVHVISRAYRVAAIGNVITHPAYRGQGLAKQATALLCRQLLGVVEAVGLNVKASNTPALRLYEQLGFSPHAAYDEYTLTAQSQP
jgi:RimJ/RimL family protein N-acetyltransferase